MAQSIPEKVLNYITCTQMALKKANEARKAQTKVAADVNVKIAAAVEALVKNERITEAQTKQAAELLSDHAKALELVAKVAAHRNAEEIGQLGTPVASKDSQVKEAGFYDGKSFEMRESDRVLFKGLGLDVF